MTDNSSSSSSSPSSSLLLRLRKKYPTRYLSEPPAAFDSSRPTLESSLAVQAAQHQFPICHQRNTTHQIKKESAQRKKREGKFGKEIMTLSLLLLLLAGLIITRQQQQQQQHNCREISGRLEPSHSTERPGYCRWCRRRRC